MDTLLKIAQILNNFITPIGLIFGGLWAYKKFYTRNEGQWNANLKVSVEVIKSESNDNIVAVNVSIDNIGNKKIIPTKNGLRVSVFKADLNKPNNCIVDVWDEMKEMSKDILTIYKAENEDYREVWSLDSGAIYYEKALLRIRDNGLFRVECRLHIVDKTMPKNENRLTDYVYFILPYSETEM